MYDVTIHESKPGSFTVRYELGDTVAEYQLSGQSIADKTTEPWGTIHGVAPADDPNRVYWYSKRSGGRGVLQDSSFVQGISHAWIGN
jgi:hypothetical protein